METREAVLYIVTIISIMGVGYIFLGGVSKNSGISGNTFVSLAGNAVLDLEDNFKIGDNLTGNIILNEEESDAYGLILLTKDNQPILTETFNLKEIPKTKINSENSVKIEDLIDYQFEEKGNYEFMFSVLDLDIKIQKEFVVK